MKSAIVSSAVGCPACLVLAVKVLAATPVADDLPAVQPAANDWPWWRGPHRDNIAAPGQPRRFAGDRKRT